MTHQQEAERRYPYSKDSNYFLVNMERAAFIAGAEWDRWISVDTELPECGPCIGVYVNPSLDTSNVNYKRLFVVHIWRGRGAWYWDGNEDERAENDTLKITHWQPLPSPPKI